MKKEAVERMKNSAEYYPGQERIYGFGFHDGYNFRKLNKSEIMDILVEFSEWDLSRTPNNGEIRTIPDNNWEYIADSIINALSGK